MPVRRRPQISDESGMTLVELIVALTAGIVVMGAIVLGMVVTMRETSRITTHVEAEQNARLAMTRIGNELQSSCTGPSETPILEKSNEVKILFAHGIGAGITPTLEKSEIYYESKTKSLIEKDYAGKFTDEGPVFSTTAKSTETLLTRVTPPSGSTAIFKYFAFANGAISATPIAEVTATNAPTVAKVLVSYEASPASVVAGDSNAAVEIRNSILLRLTPPSYNAANPNTPCV